MMEMQSATVGESRSLATRALQQQQGGQLSVSEVPPATTAPPEPPVRFYVEIPRVLVRQLILAYCELRYSEQDDLIAILAALTRLGRRPTMSETSAGETVLSY